MAIEHITRLLQRTSGSSRRALLGHVAVVAGLVGLDEIGASKRSKRRRRRKRQKRCRKLGQTCSTGGKRRCCNGRTCDIAGPDGLGPMRCCQPNLGLCTEDHDCCGLSACVDDGAGPRCLLILQP